MGYVTVQDLDRYTIQGIQAYFQCWAENTTDGIFHHGNILNSGKAVKYVYNTNPHAGLAWKYCGRYLPPWEIGVLCIVTFDFFFKFGSHYENAYIFVYVSICKHSKESLWVKWNSLDLQTHLSDLYVTYLQDLLAETIPREWPPTLFHPVLPHTPWHLKNNW